MKHKIIFAVGIGVTATIVLVAILIGDKPVSNSTDAAPNETRATVKSSKPAPKAMSEDEMMNNPETAYVVKAVKNINMMQDSLNKLKSFSDAHNNETSMGFQIESLLKEVLRISTLFNETIPPAPFQSVANEYGKTRSAIVVHANQAVQNIATHKDFNNELQVAISLIGEIEQAKEQLKEACEKSQVPYAGWL